MEKQKLNTYKSYKQTDRQTNTTPQHLLGHDAFTSRLMLNDANCLPLALGRNYNQGNG